MKKTIGLMAALFALLDVAGFAQTASPAPKEPLPPGPLIVTSMPDHAEWTIDLTYKVPSTPESVASAVNTFKQNALHDPVLAKLLTNPRYLYSLTAPRPKHVVVIKTGEIRHQTVDLERGYKSESWDFNGYNVARLPNFDKLNVIVGVGKPRDFPEFDWINADNYVGIKKIGPTECLTFQTEVPPVAILAPESSTRDNHGERVTSGEQMVPVTAYIDFHTRCPAVLVFDGEPRRYTIASPPTAELIVPEDIAAAAKAAKSRMDAAIQPLGPP